jgi:hypothetical protein
VPIPWRGASNTACEAPREVDSASEGATEAISGDMCTDCRVTCLFAGEDYVGLFSTAHCGRFVVEDGTCRDTEETAPQLHL